MVRGGNCQFVIFQWAGRGGNCQFVVFCRSVGIVRSRTQAMEFSLVLVEVGIVSLLYFSGLVEGFFFFVKTCFWSNLVALPTD
jgi:hypothetical protein